MRSNMFAATAAAVASVALSGCTGFTVPGLNGGGTAASSALHDFLTDPSCAHDDEATFVTGAGGLPASFQAKVSRHCAAQPTAAVASPAISTAASLSSVSP